MDVPLDCVTLATQLKVYTATVIAEFPIWLYLHRTGSMVRKINWDNQFGRRLKLRDLHVFFTVVQAGSMARAAAQLGVSQPTVSETIADLEDSYGVQSSPTQWAGTR